MTSLVVFLGWYLGEPRLVSLKVGWPAVAPLTALCFFISSLATLARARLQTKRFVFGIGAVLSIIGVAILGRHIFDWSFAPDLLYIQSKIIGSFRNMPSMAPATAFCFLLTGLCYLLDFVKPRFATLRFVFSLGVLFVSCLIVVAYIYGASSLYELPVYIKMSLLTAIMFFVLHTGIIVEDFSDILKLQSPLEFWRDKNAARERPLFASLVVVFVAFLGAGVASSQGLNKLIQTISLVTETQARVDEMDQLMLNLLNAESGQRGYLLTGENDYLDPYFAAAANFRKTMTSLRVWVEDHPQYKAAFDEIEKQSEIKFKELADTILLFRTKGFGAARKVVQTDLGKDTMTKIRTYLSSVKDEQVQLLKRQRFENQNQVRKTVTSITVGSMLATVLLLSSLNLYMKNSLKRSEIESEMRQLNQRLEHKIRETEYANKELESFSYSVSHDLRAPLRAMSGFGNILLEDHAQSLNEEGRKYLDRIIAAANKMSRLINGILDLSRISRHDLKKETVSLSSLGEQIVEELRQVDPTRNIDVSIEPGMQASGDPMLLNVFLQNLISNSWKFTAKKDNAKIEFGSKVQDNKRVYFVRDNGAGFDMSFSEKLFGTFQRLHTEAEFTGTGVGLATARKIIHLHGGEIWAESKVNEGATFYFTVS
jgi:signal transduction histidine kinase/uncharacterized membrane protein YhdT